MQTQQWRCYNRNKTDDQDYILFRSSNASPNKYLQTQYCTDAYRANKTDKENELYYSQIDTIYTKCRDCNITIGDFKIKVGKETCDMYVGDYGIGERNEKGWMETFTILSREEHGLITNALYKITNRRLCT